jgi:hypothetical protein
MSGGGFIQTLDFADDGTLVVTYDGGNCYIRNEATSQWDNLFHQDRLPTGSNQDKWGQGQTGGGVALKGINSPVMAIAPSDSNYIYAVAKSRAGTLQDFEKCQIWRSTDKGLTWVDTGKFCNLTTAKSAANIRGMGPTMKVDPINRLHVICSDDAGAIWRTTDGFVTITCLNAPGGPLAGVLPSAVTTGATANAGTTLTFGSGTIPAAVTSPTAGYSSNLYMSDVSDNASMQTAMLISSTTATTAVAVSTPITGTGVEIGDTIVFGHRAGIAFDRSSAVVGGITQGVYIGWGYGASAIYGTTDGCATFAAVGSGGPATSVYLDCSHDGVLYVCPYNGSTYSPANVPWRYQSSTWTELTAIGGSAGGASWFSCAADRNTSGRIAFVRGSGSMVVSNNYGTTLHTSTAGASYDANHNNVSLPRTSTDAPALGPYVVPDGVAERQGTIENTMTHGQCMYDPVVSGRLWIVEGIGVWYCTPPATGLNSIIPLTGLNKNQQSIILNQMIKAPGGTLIATSQDRAGYRFLNPDVEPAGDFGMRSGPLVDLVHGWGIDYAKDDKDFLVQAITGGILVSENEGLTWTNVTALVGFHGAVACQTSQSFVAFPISAAPAYPIYTTDGTTFSNCLFAGGLIAGNQGWSNQFNNRHMVCADLNNPTGYYAYNYGNGVTANQGLWRSTDSGANWTKMCNAIPHPTVALRIMNDQSNDFCLRSVPGHDGHLFISAGTGYNDGYPLMFSSDHGATWSAVGGTGITWVVALGKELAGTEYPAIYCKGFNADDADPTDPGGFVCTDFDPTDPSTATWTRYCRAPAGNMDRPRDLVADQDVFGKWYMPTGSTGYVYGEVTSTRVRVNATA